MVFCPEVNVKWRLEFELVYNNVHHLGHDVTKTCLSFKTSSGVRLVVYAQIVIFKAFKSQLTYMNVRNIYIHSKNVFKCLCCNTTLLNSYCIQWWICWLLKALFSIELKSEMGGVSLELCLKYWTAISFDSISNSIHAIIFTFDEILLGNISDSLSSPSAMG